MRTYRGAEIQEPHHIREVLREALAPVNEVEATRLICTEKPGETLSAVAALPAIAGYQLLCRDPLSLHDYYVDTAQGALRRSRLSVRLRETGASSWLTLKGPPRRLGPGIEERLEMEVPWSGESLGQIWEELARHGVIVTVPPGFRGLTQPLEALAEMGLTLVQHQANYRQIRDVLPRDQESGPRLAEMSLDSVTYYLEGRQVRHYEVEIEAKSEAGIPALSVIVQALLDTCPRDLQTWDHGKLSTGRAVAALLEGEESGSLLNDQHELTPRAYQKVHQLLSGGGA